MAAAARSNVGRNEPCPCGSGRKYKHCHLKEDQAEAARGEAPVVPGEEPKPPNKVIPAVIAGATVIAAVGGGVVYGAETGGLFGVIGLLVLGGYFILRNPPPPNQGGKDPSGLSFGG